MLTKYKNMSPKALAILVTAFFSLIGFISAVFFIPADFHSLPLIIFYIVLVINTYFSVKLFMGIIPKDDTLQKIFDAVLVLLYILVAFNLGDIKSFEFFILLLFVVATAKYAFLLNILPHPQLLKRKVLIDLLGTFFAVLTVGGILFWHPFLSAWIFTLLFTATNIVLLIIKPMYRLDR
jgi:hypothetical protein